MILVPPLNNDLAKLPKFPNRRKQPKSLAQRTTLSSSPHEVSSWAEIFDSFKETLLSDFKASSIVSEQSTDRNISHNHHISRIQTLVCLWGLLPNWRRRVDVKGARLESSNCIVGPDRLSGSLRWGFDKQACGSCLCDAGCRIAASTCFIVLFIR